MPQTDALTVSSAFEIYRRDFMSMKGQSKKTEESYQVVCKRLLEYFGDILLSSLTFDNVRDWKLYLDNGRSVDTVRGYIICLRVILEYFRLRGYKVLEARLIPVPKRVQKVPEFMLPEEIEDFIKEAGKKSRGYSIVNRIKNQAIISLLYASGIRVSELCSLDVNSIRDRQFTVVGKGGKARLCFIDERTEKLISNYNKLRSDSNKALFISQQTGERITSGTIRRIFQNICDKSYFDNIHPHTIRHSYATNLLKNNTNMRYVQELLGHSNLSTTQMYTHVVNEDLKNIYIQGHTIK